MSDLKRYSMLTGTDLVVWAGKSLYLCDDVDNRECEWHLLKGQTRCYVPECNKQNGEIFYIPHDYNFCPYCGGKIKEVK